MRAVKRARQEPAFDPPRKRRASRPAASSRPFAALGLKPVKPFGKRKRVTWREWLSGFLPSIAIEIPWRRLFSWTGLIFALFGGLGAYGFIAGGHAARAGEALLAGAYGLSADAGFAIGDVRLSGRERLTAQDVLGALQVRRGDPILAFDVEQARHNLLKLEWVKDARVERRLPDTVMVSVVEKVPFALWQVDGKLSLIEADGSVITDKDATQFQHLPMIVGKGANREARSLIDLLGRFARIKKVVSASVFVSQRRWDLHTDNDITIELPEENAAAAFADLDRLILEHNVLQRAIKKIDMRIKPYAVERMDGSVIRGLGQST
ncbi:MAG: FtsQ-type POTRA domain-containing protein [Alphaproteobacteria bacterium]|nr:FtsQ-type POTRA domain-containing protein [Alphaproteobacteria bacterium]